MNPARPIFRLALKIATFALMALTLASSAGGFVPPAIWSLPAALVLIFPYLTGALVIVSVIWLACGAWLTGIAGIVAVIISLQLSPDTIGFSTSKTPASGSKRFTLLTYNVSHGTNIKASPSPLSRSFSYIIGSGADIVMLQEFNILSHKYNPDVSQSQIDSLKKIYPYIVNGKSANMTVLSKYPVAEKGRWQATSDHIVSYYARIAGRDIEIINAHLASYRFSDKERMVVTDLKSGSRTRRGVAELKGSISRKLGDAFRNRSLDAVMMRGIADTGLPGMIICGDFNDVPGSWAYRHIAGKDFRDAVSSTTFGYLPTFNDNHFYFRIDHILSRGDLKALSAEREKINASDHYPLLATFELTPRKNK